MVLVVARVAEAVEEVIEEVEADEDAAETTIITTIATTNNKVVRKSRMCTPTMQIRCKRQHQREAVMADVVGVEAAEGVEDEINPGMTTLRRTKTTKTTNRNRKAIIKKKKVETIQVGKTKDEEAEVVADEETMTLAKA